MCVCSWQNCNKENVFVRRSKHCEHERLGTEAGEDEVMMLSSRQPASRDSGLDADGWSVNRPLVNRPVVSRPVVNRPVVKGSGQVGEAAMKRKTLRRCDDGQLLVSESFTADSEAAEPGNHCVFALCIYTCELYTLCTEPGNHCVFALCVYIRVNCTHYVLNLVITVCLHCV